MKKCNGKQEEMNKCMQSNRMPIFNIFFNPSHDFVLALSTFYGTETLSAVFGL